MTKKKATTRGERSDAIKHAVAHAKNVFEKNPTHYPRQLPDDFASIVLGVLELRGWKLIRGKRPGTEREKAMAEIMLGF